MRLFIAIDIPEEQKQQIHLLQQRLAGYLGGVKWVRPQGMHLTLRFFGEVEEKRVPAIVQAMEMACTGAEPFSIRFGKTGVFPAPQKARVLWVGLLEGYGRVKAIATALDQALADHGFTVEQKEYRPHLTLGRLRYPLAEAQIAQYLEQEKSFATDTATTAGLALYRSQLLRQGAVYTAQREIFFGLKGRK